MPRKATVAETFQGKDCKVGDCPNIARAKKMCDTHYRRWKKYGDPNAPDQRKSPEHGHKVWNTRHAKAVSESVG